MSYKILIVLMISCCLVAADDIEKKVDELMAAHVATGNYNGSVLIIQGNEILVNKGYGEYYLGGAAARPHHKYEIGSIAKSFTALSIMQLQEKGRLNVMDKLAKYLPDFPNGDKITLHQLLTHSSGIPEFDFDLVFKSLDEIIDSFRDAPLQFEPGSKAEYSTSGFILLRKIIEHLTGMNHQQYVVENIMKPLGMKNSGYNNGRDVVKYLGRGYWNGDEGLEEPEIYDKSIQGSIYSNTTDLFIYSRAVIMGDFLSPESKKQMFASHIKDGGITNMGHSWGYGWAIDQSHGERRIWHNGHIFGFCAMLAVYPEKNLTIVVMSNVQNNSPVEKINEALAAIVLGKEYQLPKVRREIDLAPEKLVKLAGTYEYSSDFLIEVTVDRGKLFLQGTGQPRLRLRPMSPLTFFLKEADLEIHFIEKDGNVSELIIHQYENQMKAKKTR